MFFPTNVKFYVGLAIIPLVIWGAYRVWSVYDDMNQTIENQTVTIKQQENTIDSLKKDIIIKDANISALERTVQDQNAQVEAFKADSVQKEKEIAIINEELTKKQEEIDSYQCEQSNLTTAEENMKWLLEKSKLLR